MTKSLRLSRENLGNIVNSDYKDTSIIRRKMFSNGVTLIVPNLMSSSGAIFTISRG